MPDQATEDNIGQIPDNIFFDDYDEDLAEDAPDIEDVVKQLQMILPSLFTENPNFMTTDHQFAQHHHDLSLSNIMFDPKTLDITGIVDWECICVAPKWEDTYPQFLNGPSIVEEPEPLALGDTDEFRVERWENWEKTQLRREFDELAGAPWRSTPTYDSKAQLKREFRQQLDMVEVSTKMVRSWIERGGSKH
jgi:hypothetical protein